MSKTYREKLLDPRWQKRRLHILERDGWECVLCGVDNLTLHVHHKRYIRGKQPWDAPDDALVTLCERCHTNEFGAQEALDDLRAIVADRFSMDEVHDLSVFILQNFPVEKWGSENGAPDVSMDRLIGSRLAKELRRLHGSVPGIH